MTYSDDIFGLLTPQKVQIDQYVAAQISAASEPLKAQITSLNTQLTTVSRQLEAANARIKELESAQPPELPVGDLLAFRKTLVPGEYDANNNRVAGLIEQDRSKYTVKTGVQTISSGEFYRVWFKEGIVLTGKATFRECIINARQVNGATAVRGSTAQGLFGSVFEDSLIDAAATMPTINTMLLSNATMRRCEITGGVDLVSFLTQSTGQTLSEGNWYHKTAYFTGAWTNQPDLKTHNDGFQFHRGKNFRSVGDYFEDIHMQAMMIKQQVSSTAIDKLENIILDRPRFGKGIGSVAINIVVNLGNDLATLQILNPRFMKYAEGGPRYTILRHATNFKGRIVNPVYFDGSPAPIMNGS